MRAAAGLVGALAILLLAIPSVLAQASPSPSVDISGDAGGSVAVDDPASFRFTVRNTGQEVPGQGSNGASRVVVRVDGVPEGWTVSVVPSELRLTPGQSGNVDVQVAVAPGATERASMTVVADIYSPLEGLEPILNPVPGGSQQASDSAPLEVRVGNSLTRNVLETLGPWVYILIVLLVAAVLVAVAITVSSRRSLVRLVADARERPIAPGGKVAFPFRVEGLARETDTVLLQVSTVQEGWAAFLPVPELILEPGQPQEVSLVAIAPRAAAQGTRQAILVTATSARAPKGASNLEFVAVVQGPADLQAERRPKS